MKGITMLFYRGPAPSLVGVHAFFVRPEFETTFQKEHSEAVYQGNIIVPQKVLNKMWRAGVGSLDRVPEAFYHWYWVGY